MASSPFSASLIHLRPAAFFSRWAHGSLSHSSRLAGIASLPHRRRLNWLSRAASSSPPPVPEPPSPENPIAGNTNFSMSRRRREFALLSAISIALPLGLSIEMVAAGELAMIQSGVRNVLSKAKAAGVLRMAFHDAGTFDMADNSGGMNGSIVYELERHENTGLNKTLKEILDKAKREIEKIQQVSWADLIAVAGAEAVSLCGGPTIPIRLGRLDARMPDPEGRLPQESLDASGLKKCFLKKGFSTQELVVLSGAHTLGSKGFGNPTVFDNAYFKILLGKPWTSSGGMTSMIGLPSDRALVEDDECLRWIVIYAADEVRFFDDFKSAYIKLVDSGAAWSSTQEKSIFPKLKPRGGNSRRAARVVKIGDFQYGQGEDNKRIDTSAFVLASLLEGEKDLKVLAADCSDTCILLP